MTSPRKHLRPLAALLWALALLVTLAVMPHHAQAQQSVSQVEAELAQKRVRDILRALENGINYLGTPLVSREEYNANRINENYNYDRDYLPNVLHDKNFLRGKLIENYFMDAEASVLDDRVMALRGTSIQIPIDEYLADVRDNYKALEINLSLVQICEICYDSASGRHFIKAIVNRTITARETRTAGGRNVAVNNRIDIFFKISKTSRGNLERNFKIEAIRPSNDNCQCSEKVDQVSQPMITYNAEIYSLGSFQGERISLGKHIEVQNLYFRPNDATILTSSYPVLNEIVTIMRSSPSLRILIEGHTSETTAGGDPAINMQLSVSRAMAVQEYLTQQGIDPIRIETKGYGEKSPKYPGDDDRNRRVEIIFK